MTVHTAPPPAYCLFCQGSNNAENQSDSDQDINCAKKKNKPDNQVDELGRELVKEGNGKIPGGKQYYQGGKQIPSAADYPTGDSIFKGQGQPQAVQHDSD
jgi:hypothetical protein